MADSDPILFDRRTGRFVEAICKRVRGMIRNETSPELQEPSRAYSDQWKPYINVSGETIPAHAIMAVSTASTYDSNVLTSYLQVSKPSTTFCRLYAVNGSLESTSGGSGRCALSGPVQVLYEGSLTPAIGKSAGPKPDSWAVNEGWPTAVELFGTVDTTTKIAHGFLHPITTVVAKTTTAIAAIAANVAGTGTATIWTNVGSTFAESSPKQTFTGTNFSTVASTTSDLYGFTERDGVMCMDAPASAGGGQGPWQAQLTADLLSSASSASIGSAVLLSDGSAASITSASNPLAYCGQSGKAVILDKTASGYAITGIAVTATTLILDVATTTASIDKVKRQAAVMFNESASTTASVITLTTLCST